MNQLTNSHINPGASAGLRKHETDILARTIYGEARGESVRGKEAVAATIINRVNFAKKRGGYWWGDSVDGVCRKPFQFSCWNDGDPNLKKIMAVKPGHKVFDSCLRIARRAVGGALADPTNGATHYHHISASPPWSRARAPIAEIGRHLFYSGIE